MNKECELLVLNRTIVAVAFHAIGAGLGYIGSLNGQCITGMHQRIAPVPLEVAYPIRSGGNHCDRFAFAEHVCSVEQFLVNHHIDSSSVGIIREESVSERFCRVGSKIDHTELEHTTFGLYLQRHSSRLGGYVQRDVRPLTVCTGYGVEVRLWHLVAVHIQVSGVVGLSQDIEDSVCTVGNTLVCHMIRAGAEHLREHRTTKFTLTMRELEDLNIRIGVDVSDFG